MWLKSDYMKREHVIKARRKHLHIMYLIKEVGNRLQGMGLKVVKFHAIMHMARDIYMFGVPMEYDTGSNERGHKVTKKAARLTQKSEQTFDSQTAKRLEELHIIQLAEQEIHNNPLWFYGHYTREPDVLPKIDETSTLKGSKITVKQKNPGVFQAYVISKTNDTYPQKLEQQFLDFVGIIFLSLSV